MDQQRREELRKRYLSLGWGEWAAACVFAYVAGFSLDGVLEALEATSAVWWALMPVFVILAQAGSYWLAARTWVGVRPMPRAVARFLWTLRAVNVIALAAAFVGIVLTWPSSPAGATVAIAVWMFAVAEFVNYFVMRLAYRPGLWWSGVRERRAPRLMIDVREGLSPRSASPS